MSDAELQYKIQVLNRAKRLSQNLNNVNVDSLLLNNVRPKLTIKNKLKENNDSIKSSSLGDTVPLRAINKELEIQRQEKVKDAIRLRTKKMKDFSLTQEAMKQHSWLMQQKAFIEDMHQKESYIFQALNEYDQNKSVEHAKLVEYYQNLDKHKRQQKQELERREKKIQLINLMIDQIQKQQQEFNLIYQQIVTLIKGCVNNDQLKTNLSKDLELLKSAPKNFEYVVMKCKNGKVDETDVKMAKKINDQMTDLKNKVNHTVQRINEEKVKKEAVKEVPLPPAARVPPQKPMNKSESTPNSNFTKYVSMSNFAKYTEIMTFLENHKQSFKDLEENTSLKQYKFECKKAINIPVNSLSGVNADHIYDKYKRLHRLLSGQNVLGGNKSASSHPQGVAFCLDLLATKFVLQADLMVSCNPESAFCYGSVMISLWNDFPTLGNLLLAYFYKFCPFLLPYMVPRLADESDEEYYIKQGYQYSDGQIEKQDKYLKRLTGITRLYFSMMIVKPKKGQNHHPFNLQNAWKWLASLIKLEPRVDITATVLHAFLETVGFEMDRRYGKMFQKLLKIIVEDFLPNCKEKCTGGATTRLELLFADYCKKGRFHQPHGYVSYAYW